VIGKIVTRNRSTSPSFIRLLTSAMLPIVRIGTWEVCFSALTAATRSPLISLVFSHSSGSLRVLDTTAF
jgi:hypothetical protein